MTVINLNDVRKNFENKQAHAKIKLYSQKMCMALELVEEILDDVEVSSIDWFEVDEECQAKMEAISKTALLMETYVGWTRE